mmetsp:Transcript_4924/g.12764  ORF Transcript_4924/g.12764 Transcript_4924/m.12764 type:complete len:293 (-) Transcript_4924:2131-3009(-)
MAVQYDGDGCGSGAGGDAGFDRLQMAAMAQMRGQWRGLCAALRKAGGIENGIELGLHLCRDELGKVGRPRGVELRRKIHLAVLDGAERIMAGRARKGQLVVLGTVPPGLEGLEMVLLVALVLPIGLKRPDVQRGHEFGPELDVSLGHFGSLEEEPGDSDGDNLAVLCLRDYPNVLDDPVEQLAKEALLDPVDHPDDRRAVKFADEQAGEHEAAPHKLVGLGLGQTGEAQHVALGEVRLDHLGRQRVHKRSEEVEPFVVVPLRRDEPLEDPEHRLERRVVQNVVAALDDVRLE